tara:strand:+ start:4278 stop:4673 length:396 start_codon:yes stop_codon:yes gene_type:complete
VVGYLVILVQRQGSKSQRKSQCDLCDQKGTKVRWAEIAVLLIAVIILAVWYNTANAQNSYLPCLPTNEVKKRLEKLGEERIWRGLSARGHITEIWLNKTSLKWSAVVHLPSGHSCLPDGGDHGENIIKPGA